MEKAEYSKIKEIFSEVKGANFRTGSVQGFQFTIYMNDELCNTEIDALELSVRSSNCLRRAGINTIGDLCSKMQHSGDLKSIRNCGKTSIAEIMDNLFAYHYYRMEDGWRKRYLRETVEKNCGYVSFKET